MHSRNRIVTSIRNHDPVLRLNALRFSEYFIKLDLDDATPKSATVVVSPFSNHLRICPIPQEVSTLSTALFTHQRI
ncbi:hypothetical protein M413DRAFT_269034 [Hebeloma cylindrosporum]|uniref:Uncharacterized protein n=1 Tax=Hebeloma cylindrosporum TaxID=76867 RepID=A0A0C2YB79_HEBCY|nr:hypothetical protein M413DRAFT_269034 [Hebeloma cylindrosporum h7]